MEKRSARKSKMADRRISIGDDMRKSINTHIEDSKQINDDEKGKSMNETSVEIANPDNFLGASIALAKQPAPTDENGNPILNPNASARASQNSHYQRQLEAD